MDIANSDLVFYLENFRRKWGIGLIFRIIEGFEVNNLFGVIKHSLFCEQLSKTDKLGLFPVHGRFEHSKGKYYYPKTLISPKVSV